MCIQMKHVGKRTLKESGSHTFQQHGQKVRSAFDSVLFLPLRLLLCPGSVILLKNFMNVYIPLLLYHRSKLSIFFFYCTYNKMHKSEGSIWWILTCNHCPDQDTNQSSLIFFGSLSENRTCPTCLQHRSPNLHACDCCPVFSPTVQPVRRSCPHSPLFLWSRE